MRKLCFVLLLSLTLCPLVKAEDAVGLTLAGRKLTAEEASDLEKALSGNPEDLDARTKLIAYYTSKRYSSADAKAAHAKHVLWIIENHPEAQIAGLPEGTLDRILEGEAYSRARDLWLKQGRAYQDKAEVLGNAARFFTLNDKQLAEEFFLQAQNLEPVNPSWHERLGSLYRLQNNAAMALAEYERAQEVDSSEMSRYYRLSDLAKSAYETGDFSKASRYADALLEAGQRYPRDWNYGNAIHHGNNVLGLVALREGSVDQAKLYLLKAGQTSGSPQLNSFGPNMTLAKQLIEKGERDTALQFFELCRNFWKMGQSNLDFWASNVKEGKIPDFGPNMRY